MSKKGFALIVIATLFTACPSVEDGGVGKGTISGRALDARGNPIAGALVWVKPAVTTGLVTVHADANGRYIAEGLPNVPYKVCAWAQPTFNASICACAWVTTTWPITTPSYRRRV